MAEMPNADLTGRPCQHSAEVVLADDDVSRSTTERTLREPVRELNCSGIRCFACFTTTLSHRSISIVLNSFDFISCRSLLRNVCAAPKNKQKTQTNKQNTKHKTKTKHKTTHETKHHEVE